MRILSAIHYYNHAEDMRISNNLMFFIFNNNNNIILIFIYWNHILYIYILNTKQIADKMDSSISRRLIHVINNCDGPMTK